MGTVVAVYASKGSPCVCMISNLQSAHFFMGKRSFYSFSHHGMVRLVGAYANGLLRHLFVQQVFFHEPLYHYDFHNRIGYLSSPPNGFGNFLREILPLEHSLAPLKKDISVDS